VADCKYGGDDYDDYFYYDEMCEDECSLDYEYGGDEAAYLACMETCHEPAEKPWVEESC